MPGSKAPQPLLADGSRRVPSRAQAWSLTESQDKSMDPKTLRELLEAVQKGRVSPDQAADQLRTLPFEDLGFAKVDHHRALRPPFPEPVFAARTTPEQIPPLVAPLAAHAPT